MAIPRTIPMFILLFIFTCLAVPSSCIAAPDVTVVGFAKFYNGIGRLSIGFIDCVKDSVSINFINTRRESSLEDVPGAVAKIMKRRSTSRGKVSILFDVLALPYQPIYKLVPSNSLIKIAYSTVESNRVAPHWVAILNLYFDAVIVPNQYLVDIYKLSGVTIPIFLLPLGLYLDDFLQLSPKKIASKPFVFGVATSCAKYKNLNLLIDAFAKEFGNNNNVILKIHTTSNYNLDAINQKIKAAKTTNIHLSTTPLSWREYVQFLYSLDCYILISKGEGFSVTAHEALAAGIPCILSNNTAHKTICSTGFVRSVESNIQEVHEGEFYGCSCGYNFNCKQEDVIDALRDVYKNYDNYLQAAIKARTWVAQYTHANMKARFLNAIKPGKNIFFSDQNKITEIGLFTDSNKLYQKYQKLNKTA